MIMGNARVSPYCSGSRWMFKHVGDDFYKFVGDNGCFYHVPVEDVGRIAFVFSGHQKFYFRGLDR